MQVVQVEGFDAEATERAFGGRADLVWPTDLALGPAISVEEHVELGGDDHLAAVRRQRLADEFLVGPGAVGLGRVEEGDAPLDGRPDKRHRLLMGA